MPATITYSSIAVNKYNPITGKAVTQNIALSSETAKASFNSPCNEITITFTNDISLSQYRVRITKFDDDYDVDLGTCPVFKTNIAGSSTTTVTVTVNSTNFAYGNGKYRIGLYAQSSLDYTWDVYYLFFTVDNEQWVPSDATGMEVISDKTVTS